MKKVRLTPFGLVKPDSKPFGKQEPNVKPFGEEKKEEEFKGKKFIVKAELSSSPLASPRLSRRAKIYIKLKGGRIK